MNKAILICRNFANKYNENHIWAYASSAAFFFFFSLIPLCMLFLAVIPFLGIDKNSMYEIFMIWFPATLDSIVYAMMEEMYGKGIALVSVTAITTIWAASYGTVALNKGLNIIYGMKDPGRTGSILSYIWFRVRSCLFTLAMIIAMASGITIVVFTRSVKNTLKEALPFAYPWLHFLARSKMMIAPVVLIIVFTVFYTVIPSTRVNLFKQLPGAIIAGVGWSAFAQLFSYYIDHFDNFSMYGSLTAVIILLIWIFAGMIILLVGAQINVFLSPAFDAFLKIRKDRFERR